MPQPNHISSKYSKSNNFPVFQAKLPLIYIVGQNNLYLNSELFSLPNNLTSLLCFLNQMTSYLFSFFQPNDTFPIFQTKQLLSTQS